MITDKQLEDVARVVVLARHYKYPNFITHLAKAYLAGKVEDRMIVEKAWEPVIKKFECLQTILADAQTAGWMDVIASSKFPTTSGRPGELNFTKKYRKEFLNYD